jgi:hypothetical protein
MSATVTPAAITIAVSIAAAIAIIGAAIIATNGWPTFTLTAAAAMLFGPANGLIGHAMTVTAIAIAPPTMMATPATIIILIPTMTQTTPVAAMMIAHIVPTAIIIEHIIAMAGIIIIIIPAAAKAYIVKAIAAVAGIIAVKRGVRIAIILVIGIAIIIIAKAQIINAARQANGRKCQCRQSCSQFF